MGQLIPHNVTVCGHRTSMRLELEMWQALHEVCCRENRAMHEVCSAIAQSLPNRVALVKGKAKHDEAAEASPNLTSAVRSYLMRYFREAATQAGHAAAHHGLTCHPPRDKWSFVGLPSAEKPRRGRRPKIPPANPPSESERSARRGRDQSGDEPSASGGGGSA